MKKADSKKTRGNRIAQQQHQRHLVNECIVLMRRLADCCGIREEVEQCLLRDRKKVEEHRFRAPRIVPAPACVIGDKLLDAFRRDVSSLLENQSFKLDDYTFTLREILTAGQTLIFLAMLHKDNQGRAAMLEALHPIVALFGGCKEPQAVKALEDELLTAAGASSRIDRGYFCFNRLRQVDRLDAPHAMEYQVSRILPQTMLVESEGRPRTAFRIGWPISHTHVWWASISAEKLSPFFTAPVPEMPLYIQQHALNRIRERLAPLSIWHIDQIIAYSSIAPDLYQSDKSGILMKYFGKFSLGYLVIEPVGTILLVKTFLFVTHSGTPEGDKLSASLGLHASEKRYLELDKLGTFIQSDIFHDQKLKEIFARCGCAGPFHDVFRSFSTTPKAYAATVRNYLRLDEAGYDDYSWENSGLTGQVVHEGT